MHVALPGSLDSALCDLARRQPGLGLLVLFGSRAREEPHAGSDWDFAYLGDARFDPVAMLVELTRLLETERIDLADLGRAGGVLRFHAARDGVAVFEAAPGAFERFWMEAVSFWCDAQPVLGPAYAARLARLQP